MIVCQLVLLIRQEEMQFSGELFLSVLGRLVLMPGTFVLTRFCCAENTIQRELLSIGPQQTSSHAWIFRRCDKAASRRISHTGEIAVYRSSAD